MKDFLIDTRYRAKYDKIPALANVVITPHDAGTKLISIELSIGPVTRANIEVTESEANKIATAILQAIDCAR